MKVNNCILLSVNQEDFLELPVLPNQHSFYSYWLIIKTKCLTSCQETEELVTVNVATVTSYEYYCVHELVYRLNTCIGLHLHRPVS